jgi:hypothetical protein
LENRARQVSLPAAAHADYFCRGWRQAYRMLFIGLAIDDAPDAARPALRNM